MAVTLNDVRNAVLAVLSSEFPDIPVHGEDVEPGEPLPYFLVKLVSAEQIRKTEGRYRRKHRLDIQLFAATYAERHDAAETLYAVLEYVTVDMAPVRCSQMRHEVKEGVLHFEVDYDFDVQRDLADSPDMQQLEQEEYLK